MSAVEIREGRPGDLDTIVDFNARMAAETEDVELDPALLRPGVAAVLEDAGKGRYFVAERNGEVAGQLMITYEWSDWRNGMFLWIQSVYVAPEHRRAGVFKALYAHVEALAAEPGHCGIRLYVIDENTRAQQTYASLGMERSEYRIMETPDRLRN